MVFDAGNRLSTIDSGGGGGIRMIFFVIGGSKGFFSCVLGRLEAQRSDATRRGG